MKKIIFIILVLSFVSVFNSCDTPLNEYKTKNEEEKQIIALLNTYVDSRNRGDIDGLESVFNNIGIYTSEGGEQISKSRFKETKSEWWIKDGELKLFNPDINIKVNNATVLVRVKRVNVKTPNLTFIPDQYVTLTKENNNWLITKIE